jgi:hypothetical protein
VLRELTSSAGEAFGSVSGTVAGIDSGLGGVSHFLGLVSLGGVSGMFGHFFRTLWTGYRVVIEYVGTGRLGVSYILTLRLACARLPVPFSA